MRALENCKPERVFYYFEEISKIPHGSGNTKEISDFLAAFAREHGLRYVQDDWNNIVIYKAASEGYEQAPTVILQGHMDMVCEKRPDIEHDFLKDPLNLSVEDGYVTANGTTLGGDDGIAVAYALAILESETLKHPALEVVITVDEEIGLLGAYALDCSILSGKRLINLDSEAEGTIWVSCAGGLRGTSLIPVQRVQAEGEKVKVRIDHLMGGHSGSEIDKNRANSNILMGRFLYGLKKKVDFQLISLEGGTKDNVITKETETEILLLPGCFEEVVKEAQLFEAQVRTEYTGSDEEITVHVESLGVSTEQILHPVSREKVLFYLTQVPFGVQKMSGSMKGLVETSCNMGILKLDEEGLVASTSVRSSVESAKYAISDKLEYLTEFLGGEYFTKGVYPAWEYRKDSPLRDTMVRVHHELFGKEPEVVAIHAGLECGLFYRKIEGLDCVSIGPDMKDIHTSEERLDIASTERVWRYLTRTLEVLKD
jgi:dipeptidase D